MNRKFLAPISFVLYTVRRGDVRELSNPREEFPVRWSLIRASRCVEFQFGSSRLATSHRQFLHLSRCVPPSPSSRSRWTLAAKFLRSFTLVEFTLPLFLHESVCSWTTVLYANLVYSKITNFLWDITLIVMCDLFLTFFAK